MKRYNTGEMLEKLEKLYYSDVFLKSMSPDIDKFWDSPPVSIVDKNNITICFYAYLVDGTGKPKFSHVENNGYNCWYFSKDLPKPVAGQAPKGCYPVFTNNQYSEGTFNNLLFGCPR
ncbi:hypothetical protein [Citrobacter braakii]|uniref:hypothetical protein n=1 Tax=Citrobacter braakii TaxID=57706 RepID=UPI00351D9F6F